MAREPVQARHPGRSPSRSAFATVVGLAGVAGALVALAACNSQSLSSNATGPVVCAASPGGNAVSGAVSGATGTGGASGTMPMGPCCGKVALEVMAAQFTIDTCSGTYAYSLCDGRQFECEFVCSVPAGYETITSAGMTAACEDEAGHPPSSRPIPFDGGALKLGPCSGDVVALIPAASCPDHCPGSLSYAVCHRGVYDECACDIPPGYTLTTLSEASAPEAAPPDGPPFPDASPTDATLEAGATEGGAGG